MSVGRARNRSGWSSARPAERSSDVRVFAKIAPTRPTPMTLPMLRNNVLIDDAVPRSHCGTEFWLTRNIVGLTIPLPKPMIPIAIDSEVRPLLASMRDNRKVPKHASAEPRITSSRYRPVRVIKRPPMNALTKLPAISGMMIRPERVAPIELDDLDEDRREYDDLVREGRADERDQIRGDHVAIAKVTTGHQRFRFAPFPDDKRDEAGDRCNDARNDDLVAPVAPLAAPSEKRRQ